MGLTTRLAYDTAGRVAERIDADGVATRYRYDLSFLDRPSRIERAGRRIDTLFDAEGRPTRIGDAPERQIALAYDAAGHIRSVTDAQGYKAEVHVDAERLPRMAGYYAPGEDRPLRATYRWFDAQRRLTRQLSADGRLERWSYDEQGRLAEHVDGDEVMHLHRWDAAA